MDVRVIGLVTQWAFTFPSCFEPCFTEYKAPVMSGQNAQIMNAGKTSHNLGSDSLVKARDIVVKNCRTHWE